MDSSTASLMSCIFMGLFLVCAATIVTKVLKKRKQVLAGMEMERVKAENISLIKRDLDRRIKLATQPAPFFSVPVPVIPRCSHCRQPLVGGRCISCGAPSYQD